MHPELCQVLGKQWWSKLERALPCGGQSNGKAGAQMARKPHVSRHQYYRGKEQGVVRRYTRKIQPGVRKNSSEEVSSSWELKDEEKGKNDPERGNHTCKGPVVGEKAWIIWKKKSGKPMRLEGRGKWGVLKVEAEEGSDDKGVADSVKKMGLYFTKKEKVGSHWRV